jgi:hypothetical protein
MFLIHVYDNHYVGKKASALLDFVEIETFGPWSMVWAIINNTDSSFTQIERFHPISQSRKAGI